MQGCTRVIYAFTCSFDRKSSPQRDAEEFKGESAALRVRASFSESVGIVKENDVPSPG